MDKRFLMVGTGLVAAIAVVTLAILLGGPRQSTTGGPLPPPPNITNRGITAEDLDRPRVGIQDPVEVIREFEIFREDGDTVTVFSGDQVVPQPNFVSDVVRPTAEVYSSSRRVLIITADTGRFYHPGNEPTRGEFHRNTVVTQYQAPDGETLDLNSDRHVQFRLYLDDLTRFNRENGNIQSSGPVHLVGPTLDFTGRGLDLTFNLLDQRVEQLIIERGDQLRLAQNSSLTTTAPNNTTPTPPQAAEPDDQAADPPGSADPAQAYRVTLYDNLDILVGPDATTLAGDRLDVLFTLASQSDAADESTALKPHANPNHGFSKTQPQIDHASLEYISTAAPAIATNPRSLLTPAPDDIVVKWTGRLELNPIRRRFAPNHPQADEEGYVVFDDAPAPEQAVLTLHGQPAVLNNPAEDQHITAASVGYRTDDEAVFAQGSEAHPLTLNSPELGELTATSLALSQADATGRILGPGRLAADEQGLRVSFEDRLDLDFHRHADDSLADLKSATFHGNVNAVAEADDPEQQLDLTSPSLALTLTPDADGQVQPSHLQALGNADQPVVAKQPNTTFTAESLDVDLGPKTDVLTSVGTPASETQPDSDQIEITRLRALGNIAVELTETPEGPGNPDNVTRLTAHALDADPRVGRLELFGQNERSFATLRRDGAELAGVHLILQENAQTADALGPGTFSAEVDENDPTARLNIAWSESMAFNNIVGRAHFVGNVRSASTSATDDTSLDAHTLTLEFAPQDLAEAQDAAAEVNADPPSALDLRKAHALADPDNADAQVNFSAETFTPNAPADAPPLTRITLIGRELVFLNLPPNLTNATTIDDNITIEQVIVPTRGKMLLEDYRTPPPPENAPGEDALAAGGGVVNFAGRGVTLFAWEDQLTLDAQANDLRLEQDVYMIHNPAPGNDGEAQEPIQLYAQRLVADLTETGGLGAFLRQDNDQTAPKAQIRRVNADGRVKVAQGPSNVEADHLEYVGDQRQVLLWAEPRREVVLTREDQPNGQTTAKALRWDLDNDLFTAIDPGSNIVPVE